MVAAESFFSVSIGQAKHSFMRMMMLKSHQVNISGCLYVFWWPKVKSLYKKITFYYTTVKINFHTTLDGRANKYFHYQFKCNIGPAIVTKYNAK